MATMPKFSDEKQTKKLQYYYYMSILFTIFISSTLSHAEQIKSSQSHFAKYFYKEPSITSFPSKACKNTPYPSACQTLFKDSITFPRNKQALFDRSVAHSISEINSARSLAYNISTAASSKVTGHHFASALNDCLDLLDDTIDLLSSVVSYGKDTKMGLKAPENDDDIHTWLSAALTNQETCLDGLEKHHIDGAITSTAKALSQLTSNSLSLFLSTSKPNKNIRGGRRLLSDGGEGFPAWVSAADRKLLEASVEEIEPHAVVAKDGSGTHGSIGEALDHLAASMASGGRSVIYVKAGTYNEYIKIPTKQKNVLLYGDGKGKSIIVGSKNSEAGSTTYNSATVGAMGDGFIAKDITIMNSAGPYKHQAVALRVGSDRSVVYRSSIIGYQDTLYTHSKRQFYRETDIYGTVDFVFGNSAVVFQSCNIVARKPPSGGLKNFVTAQGRSSPDQNTGISIHNCRISAAPGSQTYLGRPWKQYSRTVIMESYLDGSISPSGWYPWSGGFALKTLFYAEYRNTGPGASTGRRVNWAGYHPSLTAPQANSFTVAGFISGNAWLPSTGVSFDSGLLG
ncbi:putative pectinesterase/pectinesterase inhibitor 35 [Morus notabilis]|uniref:Pectinesterase n=1 Tax=Morus notabilis TaxID=981085 RepID=W9RVA6_9ROSA|nr:probable pectinesterase/pectinesterase inhibitor 35 [Morus notabilis]EXB97446.1 putative pectinesterase/pectinesterase inhibitor 35 [Morus notabilis]